MSLSSVLRPLLIAPELAVCRPPTLRSFSLKSPYFKLAPEDIAVLESDPAVRQRYTELVVETWLPPLRVMFELFTTQVRWLSCHVHVLANIIFRMR